MSADATAAQQPHLRRTLTLWDLVFYGIVLIQPTAPMGIFGVVSQEARGHVVTTILIGMFAMLLTAMSYGRMAAAYPSAGSAFTYVGRELHPGLGYVTGWSMVMDYALNPIICTILCSKVAMNFLPGVPYAFWVPFFALTVHAPQPARREGQRPHQHGHRHRPHARRDHVPDRGAALPARRAPRRRRAAAAFLRPRHSSPCRPCSRGASIACLTYIGFDGISTLSEEVENPRRNVLRATVLTCFIVGILAVLQVYAAQLVWGDWKGFPDVDTAFVHVAGKAGGPIIFIIMNTAMLVANLGSGTGAHLGAARLLYGMGRDGALPRSFFGYIDPRTNIPRNNVIFIGVLALIGGFLLSFQLGAEMLNFGAFIAFAGVNLAAFARYWLRSDERKWHNFVLPLVGFAVCAYLWWSLRPIAKLAGGAWLLAGIIYGAIRTRGFTRNTTTFDAPPE